MKIEKHGRDRRLTEEKKQEISRLRQAGVSVKAVADRVGCDPHTVKRWGTAEDRAANAARLRKTEENRRGRFKSRGHTLDLAAPDYTDQEFLEWLRHKATHIRAAISWRNDNAEGAIATDWIVEKYLAGKCELSERAFNWTKDHPCSPHVDRIDPEGGYVPENCRVILGALNVRRAHYNNDDEAMMAAADESWFTEKAETQESAK